MDRRAPGQRTAFMIFKFRSKQSANAIIRHGIFCGGKNNFARKVTMEVQRCFKCQKLNPRYIAATCPCEHETCELCGGTHRAAACRFKGQNPEKHSCVNCQVHGHGAGDRMCPTYLRAMGELNKRVPENLFKYFIVEDYEATLERLYPDENGEIGGGPSYTNTPPGEGWTDVRGGRANSYGNRATGGARVHTAAPKPKTVRVPTATEPETEEEAEARELRARRVDSRATDITIAQVLEQIERSKAELARMEAIVANPANGFRTTTNNTNAFNTADGQVGQKKV